MEDLVGYAIARISQQDARHGAKIGSMIGGLDARYLERANRFFGRYARYAESRGTTFDHGIDSYLRLCESMASERAQFLRTGEYSSKSFAEVERRVYSNPQVMEYHMHGLALAQFLWPEQYERFRFFCENLGQFGRGVGAYLEVGGGHALYISEAVRALPDASFDLVDISESSLALARGILGSDRVRYHQADIHAFSPERRYDFITMGEVLEHVEAPLALLRRVRELMADGGRAYITAPVNAPTVDHIYLFRDVGEIRAILTEAGFAIASEFSCYAAPMEEKKAKKLKIAQAYGAFVRKA